MKKDYEIVPAIIAKSQRELNKRINKVKDLASLIQLDVMDGEFVPNESLNFDFKLPKIKGKYEVHLMVDNPADWISKNWRKVDTVIVHIESCRNPTQILKIVKKRNRKIGFALNPGTPIKNVEKYLDKIDKVLVMTVNPGFYGAKLLPSVLKKIKGLRSLKPSMKIEVDGGIRPNTIKLAGEAGADIFVVGSYIQESKNVKKAIEQLKGNLGS